MKRAKIDNPDRQWFTGQCKTEKRCYIDRASAKAAAKRLAKKGLGNMRPYKCPHCDKIHIGHQRMPQNA